MFEIEFDEDGKPKSLPLAADMTDSLQPYPVGSPRIISLGRFKSYDEFRFEEDEKRITEFKVHDNAPEISDAYSLGVKIRTQISESTEIFPAEFEAKRVVQYYKWI